MTPADTLQGIARERAKLLTNPDKKQLRFNEIVATALEFYPEAPEDGVRELVDSCDRDQGEIYVKGDPMWQRLRQSYAWMVQA